MSQGNVAVTTPTIADQGRRRWVIPLVASVLGVLGSLSLRRRIPEHAAVTAHLGVPVG